MNPLKLFAVGVIVCAIGAGARAEEKINYAKLLVGKWEITKADPGTVAEGTIVEFTKDGKFKVMHKVDGKDQTIEGTYKVDKNTFTFMMKMGDMEHMDTITILKISDKAMSTKDKDGKSVECKKIK